MAVLFAKKKKRGCDYDGGEEEKLLRAHYNLLIN